MTAISPRGGAPPPEKAKPAGVGRSDGSSKSSDVAPCKSDLHTFTASADSDKPLLPANVREVNTSRSNHDWRDFYDTARGNVDEAIRAVWGALAAGVIGEQDASELDSLLRAQRARIAQRPAGQAKIGALVGGTKSKLALGWPRRRPRRSPDREKSRERARQLGGSSSMPPRLRAAYTECERAVLTVVAIEIKRQGTCDLSVGEIAARAGVCVRTVQNAVAEGIRQGHLAREERPQLGRRNLTNVLRIVSKEWLVWIKRGPVGCKDFTATEIQDSKKGSKRRFPRDSYFRRASG